VFRRDIQKQRRMMCVVATGRSAHREAGDWQPEGVGRAVRAGADAAGKNEF
jgi:hypothetical protein